jgi:hypothetical protein
MARNRRAETPNRGPIVRVGPHVANFQRRARGPRPNRNVRKRHRHLDCVRPRVEERNRGPTITSRTRPDLGFRRRRRAWGRRRRWWWGVHARHGVALGFHRVIEDARGGAADEDPSAPVRRSHRVRSRIARERMVDSARMFRESRLKSTREVCHRRTCVD